MLYIDTFELGLVAGLEFQICLDSGLPLGILL